MNRKIFKFMGWLAAGLCALGALFLIAANIAVRKYLTPEKLRTLVMENSAKALKREVRLKAVDFGIVKGLSVEGLEISELPDFKAGSFAAVDKLTVSVQWLPLLKKRLAIDSIRLAGFKLAVRKAGQARFNFSDLSARPADNQAAKAAPAAVFVLDVSRASLEESRIVYQDPAQGQLELLIARAKIRNLSLQKPFDVDASIKLKGHWAKRPVDVALAYEGKVDVGAGDMEKLLLSFKKLVVETPQGNLSASGWVEGLRRLKFKLKTRVSAPQTPEIEADLEGELAGLAEGKPRAQINAKVKTPALRSEDFKVFKLPAGLVFPAARLDGKFEFENDDLRLNSFMLKGAAFSLKAEGSLKKIRSSTIQPLACARDGSCGRDYTIQPDLEVSAQVDLPALKASDLAVLKAFKLAVGKSAALPAAFVELKADLRQDAVIRTLKLKAKGASMEVSGLVRSWMRQPLLENFKFAANLDLPALSATDLFFIPSLPEGFSTPPSQLEASLSGNLEAIDVRQLRLKIGKNDVAVEGQVSRPRSAAPRLNLVVKCRSFALEDFNKISAATKAKNLAGSGFFSLAAKGAWPKPQLAGKIEFKGLGALAAGLKFSGFTGTASFDDRRIDIPKLQGSIDQSAFRMDLSILDYTRTPDVEIDAELERFDAGKYLAAKAAKSPAEPRSAANAAATSAAWRVNSRRSSFVIHELKHPRIEAKEVALKWNLSGIAQGLTGLSGTMGLNIAAGQFHGIAEYGLVKFFGALGIFPKNLSESPFSGIAGETQASEGLLTVKKFEVESEAFKLYDTEGTIDLPSQKIKLLTTVHVKNIAPVYINIGGTLSSPSGGLGASRYLKEAVKKALNPDETVKEIIQAPQKILESSGKLLQQIFSKPRQDGGQ